VGEAMQFPSSNLRTWDGSTAVGKAWV